MLPRHVAVQWVNDPVRKLEELKKACAILGLSEEDFLPQRSLRPPDHMGRKTVGQVSAVRRSDQINI